MMVHMLEPDDFPMILACDRCEKPHLDCEGFIAYKDKSASLCSENCAEKYDKEYEEDEI